MRLFEDRIGSSCWLIRVVRVGKKGKGVWYLGSKVGKINRCGLVGAYEEFGTY